MTAASLTHLPLQVGGVVLTSTGRAALWIVSRYMRAPLSNTAIAALVVTSAMVGSNALYGQHRAHPQPLFASSTQSASAIEPVIPAPRPKTLRQGNKAVAATDAAPAALPTPRSGSTDGAVGNKEVYDLQRKLEQMGLFTGTVDGYYGPQTARAIRKFEEMQGDKPVGKLTRAVTDAIMAAPLTSQAGSSKPQAARVETPPAPAPVAEPAATDAAEPAASLALPEAAPAEPEAASEPAPAAAAAAKDPVAMLLDEAPTGAISGSAPVVAEAAPQALASLPDPAPLSATLAAPVPQPVATDPGSSGSSTARAKFLGRPLPRDANDAVDMASTTAGEAIDTIMSGVDSVLNGEDEEGAELNFAPTASQSQTGHDAPVARAGVPLPLDEAPQDPRTPVKVLDTDATPEQLASTSVTDPVTVAKVQRGLSSLGFLHGPADGVAGEATARAIRNFEVYFNFKVTGRITPGLLDVLVENGAVI